MEPRRRLLAALNHNNTVSIWDGTESDLTSDSENAGRKRAIAWHLAHAEYAVWQAESRYAAEFHLMLLAKIDPPNAACRFDRGILYGWVGRWRRRLTI